MSSMPCLLPLKRMFPLIKAATRRRQHVTRQFYSLLQSHQRRNGQSSDIDCWLALGLAACAATISRLLIDNDGITSSCSCESPSQNEITTKDLPQLRMCGEWCSSAEKSMPCRMDPSKIPCRGKYCATSAGFWSLFVLGPYAKKRPVSCEMYKAGKAYPIGACPCDPSCLIAEIKKERYPEPTGLGVFCKPRSCQPAASPRHAGGSEGLGTLECPCNWFGSECTNDWIPIQQLTKRRIGYLDQLSLSVDRSQWETVMKDYRPGAVVRLNMWNGNSIHELACVVSEYNATKKQLDLLVAPADPSLHPSVRFVTDLLRSFPDGVISMDKKIYINPAISGFYNARYEYFKDFVDQHNVKEIVVLATGAGLGGAISVLQSLEHHPNVLVRLFYGLRDVSCLPFAEKLSEWVRAGKLELILVESNDPALVDDSGGDDSPTTLESDRNVVLSSQVEEAAAKGEAIRTLSLLDQKNGNSKFYVQHALEHHLQKHNLIGSGDDDESVVVVCGRLQVIDDTHAILERHGHNVDERLFLNI